MSKMSRSTQSLIAVLAALTSAVLAPENALATPQESMTFTNVDSKQAFNDAANEVRTAVLVGGYSAKSIRITATLHSVESGTYQSEARFMITPPGGAPFQVEPTLFGDVLTPGTFTSATITDLVLPIPTPVANAAGTWTVRFYDSFVDSTTGGADANWDSIQITLDDAVAPGGATVLSGPSYAESEPNDIAFPNGLSAWGASNIIASMLPGETITGTTTGTSQTGVGATSADNFTVRTATTTAGIYKYQLAIVDPSTSVVHAGTLRGFSQNTALGAGQPGLILVGSNISLQTNTSTGSAPTISRINQWYGFGKGEAVHYRVTGTASTTAAYTATLSRTPVTPIVIPGTVDAGPVTISRASGNTTTVDMWLYDASYNPIVGGGSEGNASLARNLSAGTYYLAVSNVNTANSLASPGDSSTRTSSVVDMPNAVVNTSTTTIANLNMQIAGTSGTITSSGAAKSSAFDVVWLQFTVAVPANPTVTNPNANPSTVLAGASTLLTATVAPGANPSSPIQSVTVDLSSIGGSGADTMYDDGTHGDAASGDGVYSRMTTVAPGTPEGDKSLLVTATDQLSRTGSAAISLRVGYCAATVNGIVCPPTSTSYEWISNVQAGTINNASGCGAGVNGYEDYTSQVADVSLGVPMPITVTIGNPFSTDTCTVWVDWNNNGVLTDAGEVFPLSPASLGTGQNTFTGTITVPSGTSLGQRRMRVRLNYNAVSPACGNTTYGNIEDYTLNVINTNPPIVSNPLATPATAVAGSSVLLTAMVQQGTPPSPVTGVTVDLTSINGSATETMYDDGTHGDVTSGDGVYSAMATIGAGTADGNKSLLVSATDAMSRTGTASIALRVGYCDARSTDTDPLDEYITRVQIGSLDNGPTGQNFYTHYALGTDMGQGAVMPITVTIANPFSGDRCTAYVDFNRDGTLNGPGEVFQLNGGGAAVGGQFTGSITVPVGAVLGGTRMRIMMGDVTFGSPAFNATNPCLVFSYGEAEDYDVNITQPGIILQNPNASPATVPQGCDSILSIQVTPAPNPPNTITGVTADLSAIGDSGAAAFHDDGLNGDAAAGDGVYSYHAVVAAGTSLGNKSLPVTAMDSGGRTASLPIQLAVSAALSATTSASPAGVSGPGGMSLLRVAITSPACSGSTGHAVTADLSAIGESSTQQFYDDGTHGDETPGDDVFSYTATVALGTPDGAKSMPATVSDAQGNSLNVNIALQVGYCTARSTTCTTDEYISHVVVGTIDSVSGQTCYSDFTAQSTDMVRGTAYPIVVTNGRPYATDNVEVYVDWNQDIVLNNDVSEKISLTNDGTGTFYTGTISPPFDAALGHTRMRIRLRFSSGNQPCGDSVFGEVEDYSINVTAGSSCACMGDMTGDVSVDGEDIASFVECVLVGGGSCGCADFTGDSVVDANDVAPFAAKLVNSGGCP